MAVRTIYSNAPHPGAPPSLNANACAIAVGVGSDMQVAISVYGYSGMADEPEHGHAAYAIVSRAEARAIYEALGRELANG